MAKGMRLRSGWRGVEMNVSFSRSSNVREQPSLQWIVEGVISAAALSLSLFHIVLF